MSEAERPLAELCQEVESKGDPIDRRKLNRCLAALSIAGYAGSYAMLANSQESMSWGHWVAYAVPAAAAYAYPRLRNYRERKAGEADSVQAEMRQGVGEPVDFIRDPGEKKLIARWYGADNLSSVNVYEMADRLEMLLQRTEESSVDTFAIADRWLQEVEDDSFHETISNLGVTEDGEEFYTAAKNKKSPLKRVVGAKVKDSLSDPMVRTMTREECSELIQRLRRVSNTSSEQLDAVTPENIIEQVKQKILSGRQRTAIEGVESYEKLREILVNEIREALTDYEPAALRVSPSDPTKVKALAAIFPDIRGGRIAMNGVVQHPTRGQEHVMGESNKLLECTSHPEATLKELLNFVLQPDITDTHTQPTDLDRRIALYGFLNLQDNERREMTHSLYSMQQKEVTTEGRPPSTLFRRIKAFPPTFIPVLRQKAAGKSAPRYEVTLGGRAIKTVAAASITAGALYYGSAAGNDIKDTMQDERHEISEQHYESDSEVPYDDFYAEQRSDVLMVHDGSVSVHEGIQGPVDRLHQKWRQWNINDVSDWLDAVGDEITLPYAYGSISSPGTTLGEGDESNIPLFTIDNPHNNDVSGYWLSEQQNNMRITSLNNKLSRPTYPFENIELHFEYTPQGTSHELEYPQTSSSPDLTVKTPYIDAMLSEQGMVLPVLDRHSIESIRIVDAHNPNADPVSPRLAWYEDGHYIAHADASDLTHITGRPQLEYTLSSGKGGLSVDDLPDAPMSIEVDGTVGTSVAIYNHSAREAIAAELSLDPDTMTAEDLQRAIQEQLPYTRTPDIEDPQISSLEVDDDPQEILMTLGETYASTGVDCQTANLVGALALADIGDDMAMNSGFLNNSDNVLSSDEAHAWLSINDERRDMTPPDSDTELVPETPLDAPVGLMMGIAALAGAAYGRFIQRDVSAAKDQAIDTAIDSALRQENANPAKQLLQHFRYGGDNSPLPAARPGSLSLEDLRNVPDLTRQDERALHRRYSSVVAPGLVREAIRLAKAARYSREQTQT